MLFLKSFTKQVKTIENKGRQKVSILKVSQRAEEKVSIKDAIYKNRLNKGAKNEIKKTIKNPRKREKLVKREV